jgi:hypothetical protein
MLSFIHVAIEHDVDDPDSLQAVPAFQAFVAGIAELCDVPPVVMGATIVGGDRCAEPRATAAGGGQHRLGVGWHRYRCARRTMGSWC